MALLTRWCLIHRSAPRSWVWGLWLGLYRCVWLQRRNFINCNNVTLWYRSLYTWKRGNKWMWNSASQSNINYDTVYNSQYTHCICITLACTLLFIVLKCVCLKAMSITQVIQRGWWMDEWVWTNGGMILTGENWNTGRKTLYSVGGRLMNECGAMVEWYWQGKTEVLGEKHYTVWVVDGWMSKEQWWNDTDRGKLKYLEKNIIQHSW